MSNKQVVQAIKQIQSWLEKAGGGAVTIRPDGVDLDDYESAVIVEEGSPERVLSELDTLIKGAS
jgi:hypothetical protein